MAVGVDRQHSGGEVHGAVIVDKAEGVLNEAGAAADVGAVVDAIERRADGAATRWSVIGLESLDLGGFSSYCGGNFPHAARYPGSAGVQFFS